jgi:fucose permease
LAWAISALNLGGALPPAITGYIIDNQGVSVAFVIPLLCMGLSALSILPFWKEWRMKVREIPL